MGKTVEEKLEKSQKGLKEALAKNKQLRGEVAELGQRVAEADQAEDFSRLKELHAEVEEIEKWERRIELPFGKVSLRFYHSTLHLDVVAKGEEASRTYYIREAELCNLVEFGSAIAEASGKMEELNQLQLKLRPLEKMISDSAEILRLKAEEDD